MNKIYKIVWSKTKNCYVVASELTKSHTKGSGTRSFRMKAVRVLGAMLVSVYLVSSYGVQVAWADEAGVAGSNVTRTGANASAWGNNTQAGSSNATAWGLKANAGGANATAWGNNTVANGINATVWGIDSKAIGAAATAFGDSSVANGINSLAALGGITAEGATGSVAIGDGAKANLAHSIALGNDSVANRLAGVGGYRPDGTVAAGVAWVATANAISVGASATDSDTATVTRQITGVAAGTYDTDAVNVAQLKALKDAIGAGGGGATYTAGDGIDISDKNTVSVKNGSGLVFDKDGKLQVNTGSDLALDAGGKIQVTKNGAVEAGNTGIVTGGTVYSAVAKKADKATTLEGYGITDAFTKNETQSAIDTAAAKKADKATTLKGYGITDAYTKEETNSTVTTAVAGKADRATTLKGYGITDAYTKTEADDTFATKASLNNKADKASTLAGYGITNAYTKTETTAAINQAIAVKADKATTLAGYGITDAYTKTEADAAHAALSDRIGTIGADGIIVEAGKNVSENLVKIDTALKDATGKVQDLVDTKANVDASNLSAANKVAWGAALGGGTVAAGNTALLTGGTVYSELRPADGQFVKQANTTAQNLTALDKTLGEVKTSSDNIIKTLQVIEMGTDLNFDLIVDIADEIEEKTKDIDTLKNMDGVVAPAGSSKADEFVRGVTVYNEVRPADGEYVKKDNSTAENLTALDKQVKINEENIAKKANAADVYTKSETDSKFAQKANTLAGYGIKDSYTKTEVDNALGGKADKATTLKGYGITDAYTKTEVDNALGDKADKATTLKGYGITDAYTKEETNSTITTAVAGKADKASTLEGYGITDAYTKEETNSTITTAVAGKADKASTLEGYGITDAYTKKEVDAVDAALSNRIGTIGEDGLIIRTDKNIAENLTLIDQALQDQTGIARDVLDKKADADASNVGRNAKDANGSAADNSEAWGSALGTGSVENGNGKLVTGAAVYSEVRPAEDGEYVKKDRTTAANLTALDAQVKSNADAVALNAKNIESNTENIAGNTRAIATNADNIVTAQETADMAMTGVEMLLVGTGISIEGIVAVDEKLEALAGQNGEVKEQGDHADEFVRGATVYEYLNGKPGEEGSLRLGENTTKIAIGKGSEIKSGTRSVALGFDNTVDGDQNIAIGTGHTLKGNNNIAIGNPINIDGSNNGVFGNGSTITGSDTFVMGNGSNVTGSNNIVLGNNVQVNNVDNAVVLGNNSVAEADAVSVGSSGGERQIKHVAPGTEATDAATIGQLQAAGQNTYNNDVYLNNRINKLDNRVNKVGAGAAALAALHPLDMDGKFGMGLGYGNYRNANAMAMGLFYQPKDNLMFSIGGSMGNGENMVNAGVIFALDKGKGLGASKTAMARKIAAQDAEIAALKEAHQKESAAQDEKIAAQDAEIAALKEALARLEAKVGK